MNKLEYLGQLEAILKKQHLSKAEVDDIIRDYAEFFEEGRRQGQSDAEIAAKLGSPELVAQQLTEENNSGTASAPKTEFKMPEVKLPKLNLKEKFSKKEKNSEEQPKQKVVHERSSNMGCLAAAFFGTLKLCFLLFAIPTLVLCFAAAASALAGVVAAILTMFIVVICGFFAATVVAHFLTLPVTLFFIFACITLLALLVCLGALAIECLIWCCKFFGKLLMDLFKTNNSPVANPVPAPQPYATTVTSTENIYEEEEKSEFDEEFAPQDEEVSENE